MALSTVKFAKATYRYANDGGAAGAITPEENFILPEGALILRVIGRSVTAFSEASGTPTIALTIGGVEVNAATAFNHADYSGVDVHISAPFSASTTAGLVVTVADADLDAGVYEVYCEYLN